MTTEEKIKIRNNWLKIGIITLLTVAITYKIVVTDFNLSEFSFSEILSLVLSLFAIGISVSFYYETTKTSNRFYDNTYKFTKDISENLGRIEERFSEQLKGIKEGSQMLRERVEKYYSFDPNNEIDEQKLKELNTRLEQQQKEQEKLINNLATKYQIAENDKNQFIGEIESKKSEIDKLKRKLDILQKNSKLDEELHEEFKIPSRIISYFKGAGKKRGFNKLFELTDEEAIEFFSENQKKLASGFINDMVIYELLDDSGNLTENGLNTLRRILE